MEYRKMLISIIVLAIYASISQAENLRKIFDQKSAIVNYTIKGHGKVSIDNSLDIDGNATLIFDQWGDRKIYKEKYTETTTGLLKNTNIVRRFNKEEDGVISSVDFENKKIDISKNLITVDAIKNGKNLYQKKLRDMEEKGSNIGIEIVLGYQCDIWLYKGKKRCLYHGIPLKEEFTVSNIPLVKIAKSIGFDQNISEDTFSLPDFNESKKKGFLMQENKDSHVQNIQKIKEIIEDEISDNVEVNIQDIKLESGVELADDMFSKRIELMPKLLEQLLESRVCLENAQEEFEANECIEKLNHIRQAISGKKDKNSTIITWRSEDKENLLSEIEINIMDLKRKMPCIRRSKNIDELSGCIK